MTRTEVQANSFGCGGEELGANALLYYALYYSTLIESLLRAIRQGASIWRAVGFFRHTCAGRFFRLPQRLKIRTSRADCTLVYAIHRTRHEPLRRGILEAEMKNGFGEHSWASTNAWKELTLWILVRRP